MKKTLFDHKNEDRPYIAVNAVIIKKINGINHILLGKRKNVAGAGKWYLLGGHIHMNEPYKDALKREVFEETGLDVSVKEPIWIEEKMEDLHHIVIYCKTLLLNPEQEIVNKEPEKCEEWKWFPISKLPDPIWGKSLEKFIRFNLGKKPL